LSILHQVEFILFLTAFAPSFITETVKTTVSKGWTPLLETVHDKDSHSCAKQPAVEGDPATNVGNVKNPVTYVEDTKLPAILVVESNLAASAAPVTGGLEPIGALPGKPLGSGPIALPLERVPVDPLVLERKDSLTYSPDSLGSVFDAAAWSPNTALLDESDSVPSTELVVSPIGTLAFFRT
jgi:hypothetical protein